MTRSRQRFSTGRRDFLKTAGAAAIGAGLSGAGAGLFAQGAPRVTVGVDAFSLGVQDWSPIETLDWAARMRVGMVHFSEVRFLGSARWQEALTPDNLRRVRDHAGGLGIAVEIGMRSICPTSSDFQRSLQNDPTLGTADEQIARMLDAARTIGSPIVRCVQGSQADRRTGIETHIAETVRVIRRNASRIADSGVKLAIENHAGDMQARELKQLIEDAGPAYAGACVDTGNAVWAIEHPQVTIDTLAPYALTSHFRDSYVFKSPRGIATQWRRMGDGNVGMEDLIRSWVTRVPGKPVSLEVIVQGGGYRLFDYRDPAAWEMFQSVPAAEFARFLALAEAGAPQELPPPREGRGGGGRGGGRGGGGADPEARARNLADVEASVRWTQAAIERL